ncbi:MAG: branched-chain amino acid transport system ATP-binding protein [Solirubrobacteraceae bacterium]|jgi:branched-chain amino acid transport system ATP-binding protein|nr:branched-chain amino acid transport system ATP-binding protein [Solirubrobacteraceae bacterium]
MSELRLEDVHTYYGQSHVLHGVSLSVEKGATVALLGRNGMGKTTTIRSIMGMTAPRTGRVWFQGREMTGLPPDRIARSGIALVPQGRRVFPSLTIDENLRVVARSRSDGRGWGTPEVYELFPRLRERRSNLAGDLSGGEQQMLAIGRALMTGPDAILLDEPSEGLAPAIVRRVGETLRDLREAGMTILIVEQIVSMALEVSDYVYVLSKGRVVYESTPEELRGDEAAMRAHLGVVA